MRPLAHLPLALLLCAALAAGLACKPARSTQEARVTVFAASSLRDAFTTLGEEFERAYPGTRLTFSFAGSQELRMQLEHGASADVFASADARQMELLVQAGRVENPAVFARNALVLVVSREQAAAVRSLQDLPSLDRIVVGAPDSPVGHYTALLLEAASGPLGADFRARVEAKVVSRELNVRQVLAKVSLGEAQAGIVYRTDVRAAAERVSVVELPAELGVVPEYPIGILKDAASPQRAADFVALVRSERGQRALAAAGFLPAR